MSLEQCSLSELSAQLEQKTLSSVDLTEFYLNRIERYNPVLNALVHVDFEQSRQQARLADEQRRQGRATPLTGIPIAVKDIFCTTQWRTTCASRMLANYTSPYNAHVVDKINANGMVVLGKANLDEFAMGSSNENSYFGVVHNPWKLGYVPGGSSGGSAAAVAAGLSPAAVGTDTGGSIRQPAAWCGITGLKPTYGTVSRYGMVAYASSLDQGGPMARHAADCALLLNMMADFDARDATAIDRPAEDYCRHLGQPLGDAPLDRPLQGLRIGLPREFFSQLTGPMATIIQSSLDELVRLGAQICEVGLPSLEAALAAYYVIASAEASSNLSRFDGVRYGHRAAEYTDLDSLYAQSRAEGFSDEVKRRILVGTYVLSAGYYDAYYLKAQKIRRLVAEDFQRALTQCDVIAGPVTPSPAFPIGQYQADPVQMYLADAYTVPVNLAGLPALSMPCGLISQAGTPLPVGLQLIGRALDEARLLAIADHFQRVTSWHTTYPTDFLK